MKQILIAIDYNPSAEKVAETGYALAFEKLIMDDVAAKVLKHSTMPLLIVPTDKQDPGKIAKQADTDPYI